jgi:hypothetical protein
LIADDFRLWPLRPIFRKDLTSAFGGEAEVGLAAEPAASVENDPSRTSPHGEFPARRQLSKGKRRLTKLVVGPRSLSCTAGRPTHWRLRRSSRKNTFGTRHQSERTSEGQFGLATQNDVARPFPSCCISNHRGHCFNFQHYPRLGLFSSVVADRICGWRLPRACFAPSGTSKA